MGSEAESWERRGKAAVADVGELRRRRWLLLAIAGGVGGRHRAKRGHRAATTQKTDRGRTYPEGSESSRRWSLGQSNLLPQHACCRNAQAAICGTVGRRT